MHAPAIGEPCSEQASGDLSVNEPGTLTDEGAISNAPGIVRTVELLEADESQFAPALQGWRRLFDADPKATIGQHPDLVWSGLLGRSGSPPALAPLYVSLRDASDRHDVAAAILVPKSFNTRSAGGLGPARNLHGWRLAGNRFLGADDEAVQAALLQEVRRQMIERHTGPLLVEDLDEESVLSHLLKESEPLGFRLFSTTGQQARHRIQLPSTTEEYWRKFSSKTRLKLRKKVRDFSDARCERITRPDQVAAFLDNARRISLNSWQSEWLGERIGNTDEELDHFTQLALHDGLRSYVLWQGETPVAFVIATQFRGLFNYEEIAYDRSFVDLSPGTVLLQCILDDLFQENRPEWFDFGQGDAEYKQLFSNQVGTSSVWWLFPPGIRGMVATAHLRLSRTLWQTGRQVLSRLQLYRRLRRLTRQK